MIEQGEGIGSKESAAPPIPDLMAEYHDRQITIFGVTGTPEDLLVECPVDHASMTPEAKNMFLAISLNESGAGVKPEHFSYIKEIVESRGKELKITIAEEVEPDQIFDESTLEPQDTVPEAAVDSYRQDEQKQRTETTRPEFIDESTTDQMDQWLTLVQAEYDEREHLRLDTQRPVDERPLPEETVDNKEEIVTESSTMSPEENRAIEKALVAAEPVNSEPSAGVTKPEEPSFVAPEIPRVTAFVDAIATDHDKPAKDFDTSQGFGQDFEPDDELSVELDVEVVVPRLELVDLLPQDDISEILGESAQGGDAIEPVPLLSQISHFIETAAEPVRIEAEPLIEKVDDITAQVVEMSAQVYPEEPGELLELMQNLEEACEELLLVIGAEYDEQVLRRLVLQIVQEKAAEQGVQIPEWLPNLLTEGTHEQKTSHLWGWVSDLHAGLPSFHLLGRYTLFATRFSS